MVTSQPHHAAEFLLAELRKLFQRHTNWNYFRKCFEWEMQAHKVTKKKGKKKNARGNEIKYMQLFRALLWQPATSANSRCVYTSHIVRSVIMCSTNNFVLRSKKKKTKPTKNVSHVNFAVGTHSTIAANGRRGTFGVRRRICALRLPLQRWYPGNVFGKTTYTNRMWNRVKKLQVPTFSAPKIFDKNVLVKRKMLVAVCEIVTASGSALRRDYAQIPFILFFLFFFFCNTVCCVSLRKSGMRREAFVF